MEVNQVNTLLPPTVAAQMPLDVRQKLLAGEIAAQQAAAPKAPYTSRAAGLVSALTGGLGGLMEGSAIRQAMAGQRQNAQNMVALADAVRGSQAGGVPVGGASPPPMPTAMPMGQGGTGSDSVATSNPSGYDPKATEALIRARAPAYGIDPDAAVAIARSEGLGKYVGDSGSSYGPFQLHYGGVAGGGNNVGGLGDTFTKQTALDARDPSTVPQQVDFALSQAAKGGWGPWHGRQTARMGVWDGIGQAPSTAAGQLAATPGSTQAPPAGVGNSDPGMAADMPAPNAQPVSMAGLPPGVTPAMFAASQNVGGPTDGNALHRGDQAPAGLPRFVAPQNRQQALAAMLSSPTPAASAPTPPPPAAPDTSISDAINAVAGPASAGPAIVPPPQGMDSPASGADTTGPQSDAAAPLAAAPPPADDSIGGLLRAGFAAQDPATAGPPVVPPPQGSLTPPPPSPAPSDPIAAAQIQGRDVAMDPIVPDPQGSLVPPAPSSPNADLAGPQSDAAMGNSAEPSLRDALVAAMGSGAASSGPQSDAAMGNAAPPGPGPAAAPPPSAPVDLSAGLAGSDPMGGGAPPVPVPGPGVAAAAPAPDASGPSGVGDPGLDAMRASMIAGNPPPSAPSAGPSAAPLPFFASGNAPRSQMLAEALSAPTPGTSAALPATGPMPPPGGQSIGSGSALPQTGPMPVQGTQSASPGSPLGVNPDAPAPGAIPAGPAPLPPSMSSPTPPQPMGLAGNSAIADPSSPQNFQRQQLAAAMNAPAPAKPDPQAYVAAMQGGAAPSGSAPLSSPGSAPSGAPAAAPSGLMALGSGSGGAPAASMPAGSAPGPQAGNYQQARAIASQILSNPYASPQAQEFAAKVLMPQMQTVTGADGVTYGVDPTSRQVFKLFDGGAKFDANQSLYQGGHFTQSPDKPMDVAPGHTVTSFGANNQAVPQMRTAPEPSMAPIPGTGLVGDKSGNFAPIPGGVNGTASVKAGTVEAPVTTNTGPNGVTAKPLLGGDGSTAGAISAVAPLAQAAGAIDAQNAAAKEGATGQVKGAQTFVDTTAKQASEASQHVQEIQQLRALAAKAPTGWSADLARFTSSHGIVSANGDAVQNYDGLRSYLGTQLRQAGSGALRNSEMDKLSNALGSTSSSPAARDAAAQRIQDGFARQAALGQVASDTSAPDPMAKQAKIQSIQQTWQNADAAIEAHPDKRAAILAKMQANGIPVVGF